MSVLNVLQEQQFVAALIASGTTKLIDGYGITTDYIGDFDVKNALAAVLDFAKEHQGAVPGTTWMQQKGIPGLPVYDPNVGSLDSLCEAVKVSYLARRLGMIHDKLVKGLTNDPVQAYMDLITAVNGGEIAAIFSKAEASTFATDFSKAIKAYKDTIESGGVTGCPTPFPTMTQKLGGLKDGNMYVYYARVKSFKTWIMLLHIALEYLAGRRTLVVSSEMPIEEMTERLICLIHSVSYTAWVERKLTPAELQFLSDQIEFHESRMATTIHHCQPSKRGAAAIAEVKAEVEKLSQDGGLSLIVWDSAYRSAKTTNWEHIYELVEDIRALAMNLKKPFLLTAQQGSTEGVVSHQIYEREATAILMLEKVHDNEIILTSKALRGSTGFRLVIEVDLEHGTFKEKEVINPDSLNPAQTNGFGF